MSQEVATLSPLASLSETPLIGCVSLARLRFSALCLVLTAWFPPRGLLLVTHLSALIVMSCLLIKMWHLAKAPGVTRNKPKIHVICYITSSLWKFEVSYHCWSPVLVTFGMLYWCKKQITIYTEIFCQTLKMVHYTWFSSVVAICTHNGEVVSCISNITTQNSKNEWTSFMKNKDNSVLVYKHEIRGHTLMIN